MERSEDIQDNEIIAAWRRYAAQRSGFVGPALRLVRERIGKTIEEQQLEFGIDEQGFLRLQGMALPRANTLVPDAHRVAEACGLSNPFAFVQAMIVAQKLEQAASHTSIEEAYEAAFDEGPDLDRIPDEA